MTFILFSGIIKVEKRRKGESQIMQQDRNILEGIYDIRIMLGDISEKDKNHMLNVLDDMQEYETSFWTDALINMFYAGMEYARKDKYYE